MLIKEIINGISQKIYSFYEGLYDIYVEDNKENIYDSEMQQEKEKKTV